MKKKLTAIVAAAVACLFGSLSVHADNHSTVYVPADIYACSYLDGKGEADLNDAIAVWNEFMDDNDIDTYAAWVLTKHYASSEQDFDFAWVGAHRNGTAMGENMTTWMAKGGDAAAAMFSVFECPNNSNFASQMLKPPPGGNVPTDGVMTFSDCNINEGADFAKLGEADAAWAAVLGDAGSQIAMYRWWPVFGGGNEEFDFKHIGVYPSHIELGKDYDRMGNGGLVFKEAELYAGMLDCDVSRVYNARQVRSAKIRD